MAQALVGGAQGRERIVRLTWVMRKTGGRRAPTFKTLAEEAVDTIRNRILDMTLQPGTRIDAPGLACSLPAGAFNL